jgi:hypothetical protein
MNLHLNFNDLRLDKRHINIHDICGHDFTIPSKRFFEADMVIYTAPNGQQLILKNRYGPSGQVLDHTPFVTSIVLHLSMKKPRISKPMPFSLWMKFSKK